MPNDAFEFWPTPFPERPLSAALVNPPLPRHTPLVSPLSPCDDDLDILPPSPLACEVRP